MRIGDTNKKLKLVFCNVLIFILTLAIFNVVQYILGDMHVFASIQEEEVKFVGKVVPLVYALRGIVRLARVTMMFVAALLGIICGVMWYTGQQQAQGMLQKFFVAVFFIFGATAILDAILGMTVGDITVNVSKVKEKPATKQSNKQWMGQEQE